MQASILPTSKLNGSVKTETTVSNVLMTTNYDLFKLMPNNRDVNLLHIKRLSESFKDCYLISPIIVNEKYEVIDGQHRLHAARETRKPLYYIIVKGYGIKEVQVYNTNQKNWTKIDYLEMYCSTGKTEYLKFKQFMKDFPDFHIQASERILTGLSSGGKQGTLDGRKIQMRDFEEGRLIIPDLRKSYTIARKILDFKPFYKNFNRGTFVSAMLPLLTSSTVYKHKEMLHKLNTCPIPLVDCDKIESYRLLLEKIYNYMRQKETRVSLRYE